MPTPLDQTETYMPPSLLDRFKGVVLPLPNHVEEAASPYLVVGSPGEGHRRREAGGCGAATSSNRLESRGGVPPLDPMLGGRAAVGYSPHTARWRRVGRMDATREGEGRR